MWVWLMLMTVHVLLAMCASMWVCEWVVVLRVEVCVCECLCMGKWGCEWKCVGVTWFELGLVWVCSCGCMCGFVRVCCVIACAIVSTVAALCHGVA